MKSQSRKYLLSVASTYYKQEKKIEGKLKIAHKHVVFAAFNKENRLFKIEIPLNVITDICKKKSLGVIPNILILKTASGDYKFAVYAREHVVRLINEQKALAGLQT